MNKYFFTSLFFSLSYNDTYQWLLAEWQGTHDTISSLASCAVIMTHAKLIGCPRLLCDTSLSYDGWDELQSWVSTEYFPRLAEAGITHVAWVVAHERTSSEEIRWFIEHTSTPRVQLFTDPMDAYNWLTQQPSFRR